MQQILDTIRRSQATKEACEHKEVIYKRVSYQATDCSMISSLSTCNPRFYVISYDKGLSIEMISTLFY